MSDFLSIFNQYARSELMILVPVLMIIGKVLRKDVSAVKRIPGRISVIAVVLCTVYTLATVPIVNWQSVLLALFTSSTQGILYAGASMFGGILISPKCLKDFVQMTKDFSEQPDETPDETRTDHPS